MSDKAFGGNCAPYSLYSYWRSSTAYRVRIALNLKQQGWETIPVNLLAGIQCSDTHRKINPQGLVPVLSTEQGTITQSLAIIEYLEELNPSPPLLPQDPVARSQVRSMAYQIAMEMHPINNLRVLNYLTNELDCTAEQRLAWIQHWLKKGFRALEKTLEKHSAGKFCFGESVSLVDLCLIPQVYNAKRFESDLAEYPLIQSINAHCLSIEAFALAAPEQQPDSQAA